MKQALSFVTLGVADVAAARRFYVEGLGWTPTFEDDEVVMLQMAPGVLLALWGAADLAADAGVDVEPGPGAVALAHNVGSADEVHAVVARWRKAGGTVLKEPAHQPLFDGTSAYVADPNGHRWEIAHNPGWSVDDDGTVTLS